MNLALQIAIHALMLNPAVFARITYFYIILNVLLVALQRNIKITLLNNNKKKFNKTYIFNKLSLSKNNIII